MSVQNTGIIRKLWLHVLNEGGYSTVAEVATAHGLEKKSADRLLAYLARKGFCDRFDNPDRKNGIGYGITKDCKVPNGVQVKEVLAAAGVVVEQALP